MLDSQQSVASIVLDHSETASVFHRHHIDFCCKGQLSLLDACAQRGLDPKALLTELSRAIAERGGAPADDPRTLSTSELVAHIVAKHHVYLRRNLPFVRGLSEKVARVHGETQPSLRELQSTVGALIDALSPHLLQEEEVLFPALTSRSGDRELIERELSGMHAEHLQVGKLLETIRALTADYQPPPWACGSYRTLYAELEAIEKDIHQHVHLENHVLMPRFVQPCASPTI